MAGKRREITAEQRERAFVLFGEGRSINAVAEELFGGYWKPAKELRLEYDAANGGSVSASGPELRPAKEKKAKRARKEVAAEPAEEESPDSIEMAIVVPIERAEELFAEFTPTEKASAIQCVLQIRMDALLGIE